MFEQLENRRMMSGTAPIATLTNGHLVIQASGGADNIAVDLVNTPSQTLRIHGETVTRLPVPSPFDLTFSLAGVSRITVDGGAGNDTIKLHGGFGNMMEISDLSVLPLQLRGGDGNDLLDGTHGDYALFDGGRGADRVIGKDDNTVVDYRNRTRSLLIDRRTAGGDGEPGENDDIASNLTYVLLGSGDDVYVGATDPARARVNRVFGNDGNDCIAGGPFSDYIDGGKGNDILRSGTGGGYFMGGEDNDTIDLRPSTAPATFGYGGAGIDRAIIRPGQSVSECETISF